MKTTVRLLSLMLSVLFIIYCVPDSVYLLTHAEDSELSSSYLTESETLVKGGIALSFTYNANGIRTAKNYAGVVTNYILDGTTILAEEKAGAWRYYYFIGESEYYNIKY